MKSLRRRRITLDVDEDLLGETDAQASALGCSRNQLITEALSRAILELKRERIDRAFLEMANDPEYLSTLQGIEAEMTSSSDAGWKLLDAREVS